MPATSAPSQRTPRQLWMAILARASASDLATLLQNHQAGGHEVLKPAEAGTVMVEARAGGSGSRFNLGEATVTRCAIRLPGGTIGFSYALGRDRKKAELAAIADALLQDGDATIAEGVEKLGTSQQAARELASRKAAATKVDFFTMVRGE